LASNLLPGTITNLGLGKKELKGRTGEIVVHDAHVKVDACGGQVAVRFFAAAMIDTEKSDDSVNAGHPHAMSTSRMRIPVAALSVVGWGAVLPVGVAHADCTSPGDFGAGAGCAPPGSSSGSGNTESWPPTSVDWPPQLKSDSGSDNGGDSGDKGGGGAKPTPIVMPSGQKLPPATPAAGSDSTSTSTSPTPIVPVGPVSTGTTTSTSTTPTPIVNPHG
jgi:hypothetical protein